ncbi:MAG: SpoIIE family protein phosphatase [Bacteroidetes bacterium]|nr:SpoIIE family protein phosphatase [Bacteroidota bacterium]
MRYRFIPVLYVIWLLPALSIQAQPNKYGVPIITNYPYHETGGNEQNWCITQDHRGVVYVGNHEKGVLEYDGVSWRSIPIPNNVPVYSLATGDDGTVYVGAEGDFGLLEPDQTGNLQFRSLYDSTLRNRVPSMVVWKTYFIEGRTWFCAHAALFVYDPHLGEVTVIDTPEDPYHSFFVENTLYNLDWGKGLMVYEGEHFETIPGGDFFREKSISGLFRFDNDHFLVSTMVSGVFLLNTVSGEVNDRFLSPELMDELRLNGVTYMQLLDQNILVCTYSNGLYILDMDGKVKEIISDSEGLIENTIAHVYSDDQLNGTGPVWIAHWEGISKIEANNPFRVFKESSGFKNLINDIVHFNGQLFISTMSGLYFKTSSSSNTEFQKLTDIPSEVHDLQLFEPTPGRTMLLASTFTDIFIIDNKLQVTNLKDQLSDPSEDPVDLADIAGRYILSDPERPDVIYTGYLQVVALQYSQGKWKEIYRYRDVHDEIYHMARDRYGYLWVSTPLKVIQIDIALSQEATVKTFSGGNGLPAKEDNIVFLNPEKRDLLVGTRNGFYRFNYFLEKFVPDSLFNTVLPPGSNIIRTFHRDHDGDYWFSFENEFRGWTEMRTRKKGDHFEVISEKPFQRLSSAASAEVFFSDPENGVWFSKSDELYHFDKSFSRNDSLPFQTLIRKVVIENDSVLFNGANFTVNMLGERSIELFQEEDTQPFIKFRYNNIEFHWAAPYFEQEDKLQYSYLLTGFSKSWSEWHRVSFKEFTNLKYGRYTLQVKAKNVYGKESESASYSFVINRPWYATIVAIIGYILLSGLLVYVIIRLYTQRLTQENLRLEGVIQERTAEIRKQKEELTDSIEYASRIQRALLPSDRLMKEHNIDHFILFRPRDIVSGDFYWMGERDNKMLIVAADCTGHGVPGAFMSMLGMTFLDEIVIKSEISSTDEIMEALREHVISSLERSGGSKMDTIKDGMDLAMISIDMKNQKIQYSGAYNPLYVVRKLKRSEKTKLNKGEELDLPRGSIHDEENMLIQFRADQMPIGVSEKKMQFNATTFKDEGYNIYMFSDGFLDQFGGPKGKKFMSRNFKKLLLDLQSVPINEQGAALERVLIEWMGEISQIDDILVMGLRINPQ